MKQTIGPEELCVHCGKRAEGNYAIHRDGFGIGPEVPLCDACGSKPEPSLQRIWQRCSLTEKLRRSMTSIGADAIELAEQMANGYDDLARDYEKGAVYLDLGDDWRRTDEIADDDPLLERDLVLRVAARALLLVALAHAKENAR